MKQRQTPEEDRPLDHDVLSHKDAKASSPKDVAVAGEEDPGAALEDFVESAPSQLSVPSGNPTPKKTDKPKGSHQT